jgi:hypothetical protein
VSFKNWDLLANYESFELIKRDYVARHGRTPNTRHAREIAAPFTHGRSYFRAAQTAEPTVKPLLLYYGVVSLSRGLTLSLSRNLREAALAPSHGLTPKDWGGVLSRDNPDFAALRIGVNSRGSFMDLAQATKFNSLLRHNSSAVNFTDVSPSVPGGAEFSLGDILSRLPALQDHHKRWRGESSCVPFTIDTNGGREARIRLTKTNRPWITRSVADALFNGTDFVFEAEDSDHIVFKGPNSMNALPGFTDYAPSTSFNIGDLWLTALYPGGVKLSKIITLFSLSYMLGMLVRYFPMQWTALIRGQIEDSALPTIAAAVDLVEHDFPQLVLEFFAPPRPNP